LYTRRGGNPLSAEVADEHWVYPHIDFETLLYHEEDMRMRLLFLPAVAILLLADQPASALSREAGCLVNPGLIRTEGTTLREVHVRAGHLCRINLHSLAGWHIGVHNVQIVEPPEHGALRTSLRTGGRGILTYAPQPGFVGHDEFAAFYRYTSFVNPVSTLYKVDVTVTR
jgi:hypothetical protein